MKVSALLPLLTAAVTLAVRPAAAQSPLQVVHVFDAGTGGPNRPIEAADHFLYGTTTVGVVGTQGAISILYRLDMATGAYTELLSSPLFRFRYDRPLVEGAAGTFYGIADTAVGNDSLLVRMELGSNTVATLHTFAAGSLAGSDPSALTRGPGDTFYGTTAKGGASGRGTIFRFDPSTATVTPVAALPRASAGTRLTYSSVLTPGRDGRLYGTSTEYDVCCEDIPVLSGGVVFRYDPATGVTETLFSATTGQVPAGDLVATPDGMLYGISRTSFLSPVDSAVFRFDPQARAFTLVNPFGDPPLPDISPMALTVGSDGALYVNTFGSHIWRLDPATGLLTVHVEGGFPVGETHFFNSPRMTLASDGLMYGIFFSGVSGSSRFAIFRLAIRGTPPALDTDGDGLPNDWETLFGFNPSSAVGADGPTGDPDGDGQTNLEEYQAGTHPRGTRTRYFAEGATGTFFKTRFAVVNTNFPFAGAVLFRFLKDDGTMVRHAVPVPIRSRVTIDPATLPGLASANFSAIVESGSGIAVDRTMTWGGGGYGSDTETGVAAPAMTWYLAEGSTSGDFKLFYLFQNPADSATSVTVRYLLPAGQAAIEKAYVVAPHSRRTVYVNAEGDALGSTDLSAVITATAPIVVERAMYLDKPGQPFAAGHESAGVTAPSLRWFFGEGSTGAFFDEFLLLANPNPTAAEIAVDYLLPGGGVLTKAYTVPADSRLTIWVDDEQVPAGSGQRPLANTALSAIVRSTNAVPIVAERTMWWPGPEVTTNFWYEAHNSPGATTTARGWALAEGEQGGPNGAETYILIANTSAFAGQARVQIYGEDGSFGDRSFTLPAQSRTNIAVGVEFPGMANHRFGALIESQATTRQGAPEIVVERAMYTTADGVFWAAGTDALGAPLP